MKQNKFIAYVIQRDDGAFVKKIHDGDPVEFTKEPLGALILNMESSAQVLMRDCKEAAKYKAIRFYVKTTLERDGNALKYDPSAEKILESLEEMARNRRERTDWLWMMELGCLIFMIGLPLYILISHFFFK